MKRCIMFSILLISLLLLSGNVYGQITVDLGDGMNYNTPGTAPTPYGTLGRAFRQQYLILADELINYGGGQGGINSVSFYVLNLNNCNMMMNYRIRLKHTNQASLTTNFEGGIYTQVFQEDFFLPEVGGKAKKYPLRLLTFSACLMNLSTTKGGMTGTAFLFPSSILNI